MMMMIMMMMMIDDDDDNFMFNLLSARQNCSIQHSKIIFIVFSEKFRFGISCESSARHTIHMKYQVLSPMRADDSYEISSLIFSGNNNNKKATTTTKTIKMSSAVVVTGT